MWDLDKNECIKTLTGHSDAIFSIGNLSNNEFISESLKIWNSESGILIKTLEGINVFHYFQNKTFLSFITYIFS